jgi:ankyrin repeat protein
LKAWGDINRKATRDQNQSDTAGQTALHGAAFWGWNKVVKFLVAHGAKMDTLSAEGMSPIDAAMGRARGNGFNGNRIDVHKDTAALLRKLCRDKPDCTIREVSESAQKQD